IETSAEDALWRIAMFLQFQFFDTRLPEADDKAQQVTEHFDGVVRFELHHDLPLLLVGESKSCETFFDASSSRVKRPTNRSSSATRSSFCAGLDSFSKTLLAPSRNCFFQRESKDSPI